ncbi:alpha/beta family hydrolase [Conexibacter sp. CPCC 206217]|uniref:alpha/beta hydrolase family protein n=1 Tax=Conexibacter sp. CPCC 206217 TaxID=3064574 RepID=UPI002728E400|nr:alpha/beta family hydrolase [Conexibacter sp. CPCC 206217]MDO8214165.1 alpha/beta hydrolase [Conexibacter sp. CPCC 206217]
MTRSESLLPLYGSRPSVLPSDRRAWEDRRVLELDTPHGPARAHLHLADEPRAALVLGHGAGGGVTAPDLVAATAAAQASGVSVALIEQPYRVAGRRSAAPAGQLDAAWIAVVEQLFAPAGGAARGPSAAGSPAARSAAGPLHPLPLIAGGRSSGARVACRTAAATNAIGVLCLAFPLQPPQRASAAAPPPDRLHELDAVTVPTLVVQGIRDRFGMPPAAPNRTVVEVAGDHALRTNVASIGATVRRWLDALP